LFIFTKNRPLLKNEQALNNKYEYSGDTNIEKTIKADVEKSWGLLLKDTF
jgi:hypothetical protein